MTVVVLVVAITSFVGAGLGTMSGEFLLAWWEERAERRLLKSEIARTDARIDDLRSWT